MSNYSLWRALLGELAKEFCFHTDFGEPRVAHVSLPTIIPGGLAVKTTVVEASKPQEIGGCSPTCPKGHSSDKLSEGEKMELSPHRSEAVLPLRRLEEFLSGSNDLDAPSGTEDEVPRTIECDEFSASLPATTISAETGLASLDMDEKYGNSPNAETEDLALVDEAWILAGLEVVQAPDGLSKCSSRLEENGYQVAEKGAPTSGTLQQSRRGLLGWSSRIFMARLGPEQKVARLPTDLKICALTELPTAVSTGERVEPTDGNFSYMDTAGPELAAWQLVPEGL